MGGFFFFFFFLILGWASGELEQARESWKKRGEQERELGLWLKFAVEE